MLTLLHHRNEHEENWGQVSAAQITGAGVRERRPPQLPPAGGQWRADSACLGGSAGEGLPGKEARLLRRMSPTDQAPEAAPTAKVHRNWGKGVMLNTCDEDRSA